MGSDVEVKRRGVDSLVSSCKRLAVVGLRSGGRRLEVEVIKQDIVQLQLTKDTTLKRRL